jgi:LmeA-like phospholipid-binding
VRGFLLSLVVLAAFVLLVVPYFVLPPVLENLVARNVQDRLGLAERPGVELDSDPQWEMLLGEFSDGKVSVGESDLGGVRAEDVSIDLDPFSVDVGESVQSRTAVVRGAVSGQVRLTVSEDEVSQLAGQNAEVPVNGVELKRSGVTVESEASVLGTTFPVAVDGGVVVEGDALVFQPETVRAAGMTVPGYLADSLLAGTAFRYPVEGLPYGGTLTGAETREGAVVLTGRVSGVELGG